MRSRLHLYLGFVFQAATTTGIYTLSLHDALPISVPLAERGEVSRVGAEDRRRQRRRLGPRVGALAPRASRPAASPVERRDPHLGRVELARVVVAALDQVELGAEQALVLVLEKLLRGEEVRVAAPAGEGHGDVALAEARRRLDEDHALRHLEQALEVVEEAPLLGARRVPRREVVKKAVPHEGDDRIISDVGGRFLSPPAARSRSARPPAPARLR